MPSRTRVFGGTEEVISSKIFVGNLDYGTTDQELRELFGEIGEVVDVHIPKDRETGRPRGFAFVRFANEEHAAQAVEQVHGREVAGRALRLDIAEDRPRQQRRPRRDFGSPSRDRGESRGGGYDDRRSYDARSDAPSGGDDAYYDHRSDYNPRDDYEDRGDSRGTYDKPKRPKGSRRGIRGKKRSL